MFFVCLPIKKKRLDRLRVSLFFQGFKVKVFFFFFCFRLWFVVSFPFCLYSVATCILLVYFMRIFQALLINALFIYQKKGTCVKS